MTQSDLTSHVVKLDNVSKTFRSGAVEVPVLNGFTLEVVRNSFTVVLGASGSGKTTLLNLIGALDAADAGSIIVDGLDVARLDQSGRTRYRREKVGFVFQFYNLLPTLTAQENVEVGLELLKMSRTAMRERACEYLNLVGLSDKASMYPAQLSGGEQQRVAVARALARQPALILADEPTGNLDAATGQQITELMRRLQSEHRLSVIAVTHNERVAAAADRVIHIENGVAVE